MRNTVSTSVLAAWHLIEFRNGITPASTEQASSLISQAAQNGRLWFWGESALPHFVTIFWFLERVGKFAEAERMLVAILSTVAIHNQQHSNEPLPGPDVSPDEALTAILDKRKERKPPRARRAVQSWSLEPLIHLLSRRLRRQALSAIWNELTNVDMAAFVPARVRDHLLWHCEQGKEMVRKPGQPQSWKELLAAARQNNLDSLPASLCEDYDFALMFALTYPHRATLAFIKALDTWFG